VRMERNETNRRRFCSSGDVALRCQLPSEHYLILFKNIFKKLMKIIPKISLIAGFAGPDFAIQIKTVIKQTDSKPCVSVLSGVNR